MPSEFVVVRGNGDSDRVAQLVKDLSEHGFEVVSDLDRARADALSRLEYDAAAVVLAYGDVDSGQRPSEPPAHERAVLVALTPSASLPNSVALRDAFVLGDDVAGRARFHELVRTLGVLVADAHRPSDGGSSMPSSGWLLAAGDTALAEPLRAIEGLGGLSQGVAAVARLLANDDMQTVALRSTFAEIGNSYRVVQEAMRDFFAAGDEETVDTRSLAVMRGGSLMDEIHNGRGHCKRIEARYWAYGGPRTALEKVATPKELVDADETFMALGEADNDLFSALDSVGFMITQEVRDIHLLAITGRKQAATDRFVQAVTTLSPLEDAILTARAKFRSILETVGYAEERLQLSTVNFGDVYMGDYFGIIQNSTLINRSRVENAFNSIASAGEDEIAAALAEILSHLESTSASPKAIESYEDLVEEVAKTDRKSSKLEAFWKRLVELAPSVATVAGATKVVAALF